MITNGDQSAYPITAEDERNTGDGGWGSAGLTKREAFAVAAMQGMLASNFDQSFQPAITLPYAELANQSVNYADALLSELAKEGAA